MRIVLASLFLLLPNPFKPLRVPRSIVRTSDVKQVSGEEPHLCSKSKSSKRRLVSWSADQLISWSIGQQTIKSEADHLLSWSVIHQKGSWSVAHPEGFPHCGADPANGEVGDAADIVERQTFLFILLLPEQRWGGVHLVEVYLVSLKGRKVRRPWACLFLHPPASSSSTFPSTSFFPLSDSL